MKVLLNSFHLNGHTLGFHPQTQKLQPHLLTQGLTLGAEGLNLKYSAWLFTHCSNSGADYMANFSPVRGLELCLDYMTNFNPG